MEHKLWLLDVTIIFVELFVDAIVVILLLLILIILLIEFLKKSPEAQVAVLAERIAHIEPITQAISTIQAALAELKAYAEARQDIEARTVASITRLEHVIAGTQAKGLAGENILDNVFSKLPSEWQVRNFRVGNKVVEFGLRLPNNLVLPIDSKWTASNLIERLAVCDDPSERQRLRAQIEALVLAKAKEVGKYLNPDITTSFGIAVVPDAVYDLCTEAQCFALDSNVVLISHSLFIPYLLLVLQTTLKTSQAVDVQKLNAYISTVEQGLRALQNELEGPFAKAIIMLSNSRTKMSGHLSKVSTGLANLRLTAGELPALQEANVNGSDDGQTSTARD